MFSAFCYFSLNAEFEDYFIYFIGIYGLGMIAFLWDDESHPPTKLLAKILFIAFGIFIFCTLYFPLSIKNTLAYSVAILLNLVWKKAIPTFIFALGQIFNLDKSTLLLCFFNSLFLHPNR
jgi:hypothetical protein